MAAKKTITVEQIASANRRPAIQDQTLIGLGLDKLRRRRTLEDTPAVRGMINRIPHLVRVVDDKAEGKAEGARVHAAQRDQRQSRLAQIPRAYRPRYRLGHGQDRAAAAARARRRARASPRRLRRRPDAAHRRLPKRGFNKRNRKVFNEINARPPAAGRRRQRARCRQAGRRGCAVAAGLVRRALDGMRLLGGGEIKAKLALTVDHATQAPRRRSRRPADRSS